MQVVGVFGGVYLQQCFVEVEVFWQWVLNQEVVDFWVGIELIDDGQQIGL